MSYGVAHAPPTAPSPFRSGRIVSARLTGLTLTGQTGFVMLFGPTPVEAIADVLDAVGAVAPHQLAARRPADGAGVELRLTSPLGDGHAVAVIDGLTVEDASAALAILRHDHWTPRIRE